MAKEPTHRILDFSQSARYLPATGIVDFMQALQAWLPPGWQAHLQMEDPLTHTMETMAASEDDVRQRRLLALGAVPEAFSEVPDPWILNRLGLPHCQVFPLHGDRPFGRLLLVADEAGEPLTAARREQIAALCEEAAAELERARAHRVDERFTTRLRRITETELGIRLAEACLDLLTEAQAVMVTSLHGQDLKVVEVRHEGRRKEKYLYHLVDYSTSHVKAAAATKDGVVTREQLENFSEGELLSPFLEALDPLICETLPLVASDRLLGGVLVLFDQMPKPEARDAMRRLARAAAVAYHRVRPERRRASSLLYLQELLHSSRGGLDQVLRTVVEEIVAFLGADAGVLALVDADTGRLLMAEPTGYPSGASLPSTVPLKPVGEPSILAHVVRTGEAYVASDAKKSEIYLQVDETVRSEIAVPLRLKGETVGVALASSRTEGFFIAEDALRFQIFADQVAVAVDNARLLDELRRQQAERQAQSQRLRFGFDPTFHAADIEYHFGNLVGDPRGAMGEVFRTIERVAFREQHIVLILGETGTGKEMVAHALHAVSPRAKEPLVATNFAALGGDPNLVQSELFGHEKGAFTGAVRRHKGCFEQADGSTLLIDELGDLVASAQVKLLRVLGRSSTREFQRLGGEETVTSDVRVLAATHRDLQAEVAAGRFREDLYYRLSSLVVRVPPLRERPEDIPLLVRHFLPQLAPGVAVRIEPGVIEILQRYPFPGNVRQLESVLLRALVMYGEDDSLTARDVRLALDIEDSDVVEPAASELVCPDPPDKDWFWHHVHEPWKEHRLPAAAIRHLLERHLQETGGFYSRVASRLGIERKDYQRFLDFLSHAGLKVDHRPFRSGPRS